MDNATDMRHAETPAPGAGRWAALAAAYFLAILAAYGRIGEFPWLLDDTFHFAANPTVRSWRGLGAVWAASYWEGLGPDGLYRPLLKTLWIGEIAGLGGGRWAVLLVSVALHALNAVLVAALALKSGAPFLFAAPGGLWFALHAANAEAIAFGVGQGEIASLTLALGALLLALPPMDKPLAAWRIAACVALTLANCFVKEHAYAAGAVCATALAANAAIPARRRLAAASAIAAALLAAVALHIAAAESFGPQGDWRLGSEAGFSLARSCALLGRYIALAAAPIRLNVDYSWMENAGWGSWSDPMAWLGLAAGAALALGGLWAWKRGRIAVLALIAQSILPLGLFLGIRPIGAIFAERFAYHALAGQAALLAWIAAKATERRPQRQEARQPWRGARFGAAAALTAYALALGAVAWARAGDFRSGLALWQAAWASEPRNYMAPANIAYYRMTLGRFAEARQAAEASLDLRPGFADALMTLGELDIIAGHPSDALQRFEPLADHPRHGFRARIGSAIALARLGRNEEARALAVQLSSERPGAPELSRLNAEIESNLAQ
ncbi:MAG: hypothetical protein BWZ10_00070 [candidate division BRC1 bacterium ADurb.BinA364]|nr:MAG: hypothetical protein BWZ10_00070 [candidate division BRC1 bacterium ADurb.BinA364]